MAKKQGANTSLIQGAGVAYRDYSNAPGMYSGLDKIIEVGTDMSTKAMQDIEAEKLRVQQEEEDAKALKAQQDKEWYNLSADVYANAGSFMKDVEYRNTAQRLTALKQDFIDAQNSGNPEEMAAVQIEFNNIKSEIDDHKAFRKEITSPDYGLSAALDHSDEVEGSNGEEKAFLTKLINEEYEIQNIDGKKYYVIDGIAKTMKEIKEMAVLKDVIPFSKYVETKQRYENKKNWNKDNVTFEITNNVVPKDINKLRAFLADDSNGAFGNGKNFKALLKQNEESIKKEINTQLFDKGYMKDGVLVGAGDGSISPKEFDQFILAIVDPKHKTWLKEDGSYDNIAWQKNSTKIAVEQLVNAIGNSWSDNNQEETIKSSSSSGDFEEGTGNVIDTSAASYETNETDEEVQEEVEKSSGPLAQQMLDEKYSSGKNVFNKSELRSALASGNVSEEILIKYLSEIPGITIENGVVKGLDQRGIRFSTAFNNAMRKLQKEENINLGYR